MPNTAGPRAGTPRDLAAADGLTIPVNTTDAARLSVRPLLPGSAEVLREEVLRLGGGIESLPMLAARAAVEALAVRGLEPDELRILEREAQALGVGVVSDAAGRRAVVLGALQPVSELPWRLVTFGRRSEPLGLALADCLAGKGTRPTGWLVGGRLLRTGARTLVMGIVNATPDSFSGDGLGDDVAAAVERGLAMVAGGADLLDVGGESTRPHSAPVDEAEEIRRAVPVVEALAARSGVPVSIDTRKAAVAEAAIAAGATIVNDIWGLRRDRRMAEVCAAHATVGVVVMHNQRGTEYADLMEDVAGGLRASLAVADDAGIEAERIVIDPGFGFGKTPGHNLELVRRLGELRGMGRPILIGPSRKSTVGIVLRDADGTPAPQEERLEGTLALGVLSIAAGADIIRAHDVAATVRAVRLADAVVRGVPAALRAAPAPGPTG